jgi:hypothetical protein
MAHPGIPERDTQTRLAVVFLSVLPKGNLLSAIVFAFLSVIPEGNLLSAFVFAFLSVIPKGNLLQKAPKSAHKGPKSVAFAPEL